MVLTLKTTIYASAALAGLLNLAHFSVTTNRQIQSSFTPSWNQSGAGAKAAPAGTITPQAPASTSSLQAPAPTPAPAAAPADPAVAAATILARAGLKTEFASSYLSVQVKTGTPWQLVAAVHRIETNQRGDTPITSSAGAKGPMQFMPGTWRAYALDGDGNGTTDITDVDDALLTGGRYLAASGAAKGKYSTALYSYNHSNAYVGQVLGIARKLGLQ